MSVPSDPRRPVPTDHPSERMAVRRRRRLGLALAGSVVIAGGLGIGAVEVLRLPKGSMWIVVAATVGLVALIRSLTIRR